MPEDEPKMVDESALTLTNKKSDITDETVDDSSSSSVRKNPSSFLLTPSIDFPRKEEANMSRENSSTGLTELRMQDGLNRRNSSVEDFLSLAAAGDIPHQDPALLNVPLMQHQQNERNRH
jgi:hypothetical protein